MLIEVLDEALLHGVRAALAEDIGSGDITAALIPANQQAQANVICRETAVLCGMAWFNAVFAEIDTAVDVSWQKKDGDALAAGDTLCTLRGPARAILSGERTALNFLQTLSATASLSRRYAGCVADLPVKILDTRKTIPGLRAAQKYAVRTGGCHNHRAGLYDAILIKENHIAAAGSIAEAVAQAARDNPGKMIEVEVENETEISAALDTAATRLLLDNFSTSKLRSAVERVNGRVELEASGSFNLENLRETAETGVDYISVGGLTKNIRAVDLSMRFESL
jgi:nicotinate-nucleotide pyrophosphorylase (carboxylating)